MNGTNMENMESHLCELMWRNWNKGNKIEAFLNLVTEVYKLDGPPQFTAAIPYFSTWNARKDVSS